MFSSTKRTLALATLTLTSIFAPAAMAKPATPPPAKPAEAAVGASEVAKDVARYITDTTILVIRVDVRRANFADAIDQAIQSADRLEKAGLKSEDLTEMRSEMNKTKETAAKWRLDFLDHGGTHLWLVISMPTGNAEPAIGVVPIGEHANVEKLTELLKGAELPSGNMVRNDKTALVVGHPKLLEGLPGKPKRAAAIDRVIALTDNAPYAVMYIPTAAMGEGLSTMTGALPAPFNTPATAEMVKAVLSAGIGFDIGGEGPMLRIAMATKNDESAKAVHGTIKGMIDGMLKDIPEGAMSPIMEGMIRDLIPVAKGDKLETLIAPEGARKYMDMLVPAMMQGRAAAKRAVAMSNIRQIVMGCIIFANDNKEKLPATLAELAPKILPEDMLKSPRTNSRGYIYRGPLKVSEILDPSKFVLIYEDFATFPAGGVAAGFADGHVEMVMTKAELDELLKRTPASK